MMLTKWSKNTKDTINWMTTLKMKFMSICLKIK